MGSVTTHGFPYPVGTDRVMDGDNAMQALAQYTDDFFWAGGGKLPRCKLTTSSFIVPNNVTTQVAFNAIAYDTDAMADTVAGAIKIVHAGWYVVSALIPWFNNATGHRVSLILNSGAAGYLAQDYRPAIATTSAIATVTSEPVLLPAGSTVILRLLQNSGGNLTLTTANGQPMSLSAVAFAAA